MMTSTKRSLYTALAGVGAMAVTGAQAVNVSADGRGQVLLYPYYTTRANTAGFAYGTVLSVVNTDASAKAVRVRFLEGRNSREVLGFNLFLSPMGVWTAAILPDTATGGARMGTNDPSCTLPAFSASFAPFVSTGYTGLNDDGAGTGLDRTKEGHFEIIEMATYASTSTTGKAITHVNGVPPCGSSLNDAQAALDAQPPAGGLFGAMALVNAGAAADYTVDAVALANFYQVGSNYEPPGTSLPNLTQAAPPISTVRASDGTVYESLWSASSADPVSAVLMHDNLINEFALDSATKSGTDWVVTLPTKRYYISSGTGNASRLFQRNFSGNAGSCDDVKLSLSEREERRPPGALAAAPAQAVSICWTANVITFNNNSVLGSTNAVGASSAFQNGRMTLAFPRTIPGAAANVHRLINEGSTSTRGTARVPTTGNTVIYGGLPAIGFAAVSFTVGMLQVGAPPPTVPSNYSASLVRETGTTIQ